VTDTTIVVNYGHPDVVHRVEFRLGAGGDVVFGRYLPGHDGVGRVSGWEAREPDVDDADHVRLLEAIREILTQYGQGALADFESREVRELGRTHSRVR
jgi:hypothetical protein